MQQTCPTCGRESLPGARFCRNCGAPLFTESEATTATTRNYPPQSMPPGEHRPPSGAPGWAAPFEAHDTARLYRAPAAPYPVPAPSKSSTGVWVALAIFCVLVVAGIVSAVMLPVILARRDAGHSPPPPAIEIKLPDIPHPPVGLPDAPPPPPPPPGGEAASGIERLKYPNATVEKKVSVMGAEVLRLSTSDKFEDVKKFYQERLGPPMVEEDRGEEKAVFTSLGAEKIIVSVQVDASKDDQVHIDLVRTRIRLPNIEVK